MTRGLGGLLDHHHHHQAGGGGGGGKKTSPSTAESSVSDQNSTGLAFECTTITQRFLHMPQLTFDIVVSSLLVSRSVNARHSYIYQSGKSVS